MVGKPGSWKARRLGCLEAGKLGGWLLDTGYWMLDTERRRAQGARHMA